MRCRHRSKGYQDGRNLAEYPHMRIQASPKSRMKTLEVISSNKTVQG